MSTYGNVLFNHQVETIVVKPFKINKSTASYAFTTKTNAIISILISDYNNIITVSLN